MVPFQYDPQIFKQFPGLASGAMLGTGLKNGPTNEALRRAYSAEQSLVLKRIGNTPLSELETLAGWRAAFRRFGVDPTQYRSAAEALLRRLTKKGDIPSINTIVDICNLVSIRYGLPVAAFDRRYLKGPITVHFASGSERFTPLGEEMVEHPEPGEVIFSDETGLVVARRWCWRQSDESAARHETEQVVFTLEAQHKEGLALVEHGLRDLHSLLLENVGGEYQSTTYP
jgi:DNA/RNA-binding domain of Phe-tRNA-synthetase-like protein